MSRIIVDVTQLVHWPGRLTGIPRVVQEIGLRFTDQATYDVVYASWVKERGEMCEVDLRATLAIRGNGIEYIKTGQPGGEKPVALVESPAEPTALSMERQVKNLAKKVIRRVGADNWSVVRDFRQKLYERSLDEYAQVDPQESDILFIGAGEWWDDNFIALVERYHGAGVKVIQVSHDMLPVVTPQFAGHATDSLSKYNARIMPIASLVLAVSESTKRDLTAWLESHSLTVPRIEVFRLGEDFTAAAATIPTGATFTNASLKGNDYIVCVGTIEARKNHALLYYVYKLAKARSITLPKIVVVGRRGWKTEDMYEYITHDPETRDDFIMLHDASDNELSWLYDHALFSIYPSFYEGWGMPIAESIMRGTVCLASNTSSMPEVAPGFAEYFSPSSADELLDGIMNLLRPGELEKKRGRLKDYKPTYWDDSFKQVLTYVESV